MTEENALRIYVRNECAIFRKTTEEFGGLSNMAPGYPLEVNSIKIRSAEALYQACRFPDYPDIQMQIIDQRSPMTAKMITRPHLEKTRHDWFQERIRIMQWCLRVKLLQNYCSFSNLLRMTGEKSIVEDSRKDEFWGAKANSKGELVGANVLGRLLMELRSHLLEFNEDPPKELPPPSIVDFNLFGEPVLPVLANLTPQTRVVQGRLG